MNEAVTNAFLDELMKIASVSKWLKTQRPTRTYGKRRRSAHVYGKKASRVIASLIGAGQPREVWVDMGRKGLVKMPLGKAIADPSVSKHKILTLGVHEARKLIGSGRRSKTLALESLPTELLV
jgi:hypothetical protein